MRVLWASRVVRKLTRNRKDEGKEQRPSLEDDCWVRPTSADFRRHPNADKARERRRSEASGFPAGPGGVMPRHDTPILHDSPSCLLSYQSRSIPLTPVSFVISIPTPVSQFSLFPCLIVLWLFLTCVIPFFLLWTLSRISNMHYLLAYKPHVAGREGAS